MRILLLLPALFICLNSFAGIGHTSVTFIDDSRGGRDVTAEVYYPALADGDETEWEAEQFPILVFGHGFVMDYDAYQNIWEALVPAGYIVVLSTNETGFAPNHSDYGLDLRFLATSLESENADPGSFFYTHLSGTAAVAGHSMGGGASVLAASGNSVFDAYIGLAPAETNPSAINAAVNVSIPSIILSGSADGITPAAQHHIPIYDALGSDCKIFVNIIEGSHCYFANSGSLCDLGEFNAGDMDRATQQAITQNIMLKWLNTWLKGLDEYDSLISFLSENIELEAEVDCELSVLNFEQGKQDLIYPNPCDNYCTIQLNSNGNKNLSLFQSGKYIELKIIQQTSSEITIDTSNIAAGIYTLTQRSENGHLALGRLLVVH